MRGAEDTLVVNMVCWCEALKKHIALHLLQCVDGPQVTCKACMQLCVSKARRDLKLHVWRLMAVFNGTQAHDILRQCMTAESAREAAMPQWDAVEVGPRVKCARNHAACLEQALLKVHTRFVYGLQFLLCPLAKTSLQDQQLKF